MKEVQDMYNENNTIIPTFSRKIYTRTHTHMHNSLMISEWATKYKSPSLDSGLRICLKVNGNGCCSGYKFLFIQVQLHKESQVFSYGNYRDYI